MKTDTALEYAQALVDDLDPGKTVASVAKTGVLEVTLTMTDGTTTTASGLFASQLCKRLEAEMMFTGCATTADYCLPTVPRPKNNAKEYGMNRTKARK
jgi:hypothetical protein